jgi:hypothetical protein
MTQNHALSFARDIRPLFTDTDVDHMKNYGLDLSSRDDVVKHAKEITSVVSAGTMPPPSDGGKPWSLEMCEMFRQWVDQGCLP